MSDTPMSFDDWWNSDPKDEAGIEYGLDEYHLLREGWRACIEHRAKPVERENAALRAELEGVRKDAVPVADILANADHVAKNGAAVARFGGQHEHEGRCRELCAMYLRELVSAFRLKQQIAAIDAAKGEK